MPTATPRRVAWSRALALAALVTGWDALLRALWVPGWLSTSLLRNNRQHGSSADTPAYLIAECVFLIVAARGASRDRSVKSDASWNEHLGLLSLLLCAASLNGMLFPAPRLLALGGFDSQWDVLVSILETPLYAALVEELLFRGLVQSAIARVDAAWAMVASAASFAVLHGNGWLWPAALGLGLAALRRRGAHLWSLVLIHAAYNVVLLAELLFRLRAPRIGSYAVLTLATGAFVGVVIWRQGIVSLTRQWTIDVRTLAARWKAALPPTAALIGATVIGEHTLAVFGAPLEHGKIGVHVLLGVALLGLALVVDGRSKVARGASTVFRW